MFMNCLLVMLFFTICTSRDTITINQTLADGDTLISKDSKFALGFFSPGKSTNRYLGIWFHKAPGQAVAWVANRNNPINGSSGVLSINECGNLILYCNHDQTLPLWSINVSFEATDSSVAQLLDTGNFVLVEKKGKRILWQSFDYPTDTVLPGMKLGLKLKTGLPLSLTSWKSQDDPGTGEYSYKLNTNGSPQFFISKGSTSIPYWRCGPHPWIIHPNDYYRVTYVNNEDEISYSHSIVDTSVATRILLDHTGLLKRFTWKTGDGYWKEFWSVLLYRCERYGHCGANSNCNSDNHDRFECTCLPGYEPRSPRDWSLRYGSDGCIRKRIGSSSMCGDGEGFVKLRSVKLPDTTFAVEMDLNTGMECEQVCLKNCSCTAYTSLYFSSTRKVCLTWYGKLMDTAEDMTTGFDLYVRVDAIELAESRKKSMGFLKWKRKLQSLLSSAALTFFCIIIVVFLWIQNKRKRKGREKKRSSNLSGTTDKLLEWSHPELPIFELSTIFAATNNFAPANKLGQGGFGPVYKGQLTNGQEIAVKRLSNSSSQGMEEFENEVMLIANLQHRNLVRLLGCCVHGQERMLIYEYLPNKSLDSFLFDETRRSLLDWTKRFDIIVGIARGILYLHQDSRLRIIHRDLKTSNILLDAGMNPKISDFGTARVFKGSQVPEKTTRVVGTYGYMSPEYVTFGKFSVKSDVYSFGVMLLEIITGKKNTHSYQESLGLSLIGQVWELWREDRALDIIDSSLKDSHNLHEVLRCIHIGLLCVQDDARDRPNMSSVVLMLNGETALRPPTRPAFTFRRNGNDPNSLVARRFYSINKLTITDVVAR